MNYSKEQEAIEQILDLISKYSPSNSPISRANILHDIHRTLLEFNVKQLVGIINAIYSASFACQLLEQGQLNEPYSFFCFRILDHFCLVPAIRKKIVSFGVVKVCLNTLKTCDYEKCISALSLLTGVIGVQEVYLDFIENQGVKILYNLLQSKEVEFIFYILRIFDWLLSSQKMYRDSLLHMGIVDVLRYNIKNNAELQKSTMLFGQAKRIKDELEILEQHYFSKAF
ncbi:hypothetical protein SteCoe_31331 [Stentor coeruleus]|uniref:Armadillo repeat-containing domain-containing protein n=1 Tax=Stentor coeruleus TaxID=5963 RepID=A0A1R2B1J1_9CILI|nr:hypothetical protein SteCoe_31331 [Stentor coeruleus]